MKYKKGQVVYVLGKFKARIVRDHDTNTGIPVKLLKQPYVSDYEAAQIYSYSAELIKFKQLTTPSGK